MGTLLFSSLGRKLYLKRVRLKYGERLQIDNSLIFGAYSVIELSGLETRLSIGQGIEIRKFCSFYVYNKGNLVIDNGAFFNNYCSINCLGRIEIGQNTLFGEGVKIYDHNHAYAFDNDILRVERNNFTIGTVKIGKNCWIGSNVTILNNVEIGDNVIIGANCLIHKSVPPNTIVRNNSSLEFKGA